jgi:DNA polymerase-3 subunit epsilon
MDLTIDRPIAFFDIESTGTSPRADRIIELAITMVMPDGERQSRVFRVNPGIPIPPESTAIHGITDADVADCPLFGDIAREVRDLLEGADLGGYNVLRYDIPLMQEEFMRSGLILDMDERRVIDVQRIFHQREPRDLTAALAFYCGDTHDGAHGAQADVDATIRVLEGQLVRYTDLPRTSEELAEYCNPRDPTWVDRAGRLKWANGEVVLNFSRKKGETLKSIIETDPGFIKWMLRSDFPRDTLAIVENATQGKWPNPPGT